MISIINEFVWNSEIGKGFNEIANILVVFLGIIQQFMEMNEMLNKVRTHPDIWKYV